MTDDPKTKDSQVNDSDPADPDFWHSVARMTVLDLVKALVEFLETRKE